MSPLSPPSPFSSLSNSVNFFVCSRLCPTLCDPMDCSMPGSSQLHYLLELLKFMSIESNHLILWHSLLLPSILPSIRVFASESALHQVVKVLEVQLQHQSFQWVFRVNSFRVDWFDLLAVQGTLRSLLQHNSLKASVLQCSAFFIVQLSHPHIDGHSLY